MGERETERSCRAISPEPDFRRLFRALPGAHAALLPDLTLVDATDAYLAATATSRDEILGRSVLDVAPSPKGGATAPDETLRASLLRVLSERRSDRIPPRGYLVRRRSTLGGGFEERHWAFSNSPVLGEDGSVAFILHCLEDPADGGPESDITALRIAREAAETANRAKSDFLSSMSHELRTPLNAILGFAELLHRDKKDPLSGRHRERAAQILKGGEHLLRLIDDILDLSKIEAGGVSISTEPVSVADVLEEVERTLEPMAARQRVRLEIAPVPPDVQMVAADRTRFLQIVMNLGSNAVKYNRADGKVTFAATMARDNVVRVTVTDTGIGVPDDKQSKLFQPFQRAGQETGPIEGTGIGLVITKRLAELMRGDVGFRSVRGEGSSFWVDIPGHASHSSASMFAAARVSAAPLITEGQKSILYIEDNPANVAFMKDLVTMLENVELLCVPTAEMGVELARRRLPDAIVMDINLPGMSGHEALRALQRMRETQDIPVIALTAAASLREKQRGVEGGFYRYLTKPLNVNEFVNALEGLLSPRH